MNAFFRSAIAAVSFLNLALWPSEPDLATRRNELREAHRRVATNATTDFIGAISAIISPQGIYGAAVATLGKGPAAARAFLERDTLNAGSRALMTVVRLDVSADGDDGYSYGYFDLVRPNGDTLFGAYKAYWRRRGDGQWQALAFGRGPRTKGPPAPLPDSLQPTATRYTRWPVRDSVEAWSALRAAEVAFSDSAAVSVQAAFASFAALDAGKVAGATYVFGPVAIGELFRIPPPGLTGIAWHADYGSVAKSNDLGFNIGPVRARNVAGQQAVRGHFFTIWRRQPNGDWKYIVD